MENTDLKHLTKHSELSDRADLGTSFLTFSHTQRTYRIPL